MTINSAPKRKSGRKQRVKAKTRKQLLRTIKIQRGKLAKMVLASKRQRVYYRRRIRGIQKRCPVLIGTPFNRKTPHPLLNPLPNNPKTSFNSKTPHLPPNKTPQYINEGPPLKLSPVAYITNKKQYTTPRSPILMIPRKTDLLFPSPPFKTLITYISPSDYDNLLLPPGTESTYVTVRLK